LVTVSFTLDFLTLSGTAEHLEIVAVPGDPLHTIPSTFGPPKAQVAATFVAGMVIKQKHTETLKTFINSMQKGIAKPTIFLAVMKIKLRLRKT
jgi:hypothetical protein